MQIVFGVFKSDMLIKCYQITFEYQIVDCFGILFFNLNKK